VNRKLYALLSVLIFASIVLAGCAPAATPTSAPATTMPATVAPPTATSVPKIVTIAYSQEPDNVIGEYSNMTYTAWLDQMVGAGLGTWDGTNTFVADLASEVPTTANGDISADGLTITWKLKPGLKWSDGQPLTSKDILFTWQTQIDPKNAPVTRSGFNQISSIDTPNDTTAVLHFSSLYPSWQSLFDVGAQGVTGPLLPSHLLQGQSGLEKSPLIHSPTVFNGPFMIKEWVAGDHMTLVPNPNYYGAPPKLSQVNIKFVASPQAALAALKTGDVDFVPDFAESDIKTISALEPAQHLRVDATPSFEHLFFNLGITNSTIKDAKGAVVGNSDIAGFCPFQDVNVRKAIMLGIDRQTIVNTLLSGKTTVPADLWPNSSWENSALKPYPFDATQAASLLDAAGYKVGADGIRAGTCGGKPVKFSISLETTVKQLRQDEQAAIQANLKTIGIDVKTVATPAGTFFGSYSAGANMPLGKFNMAIFTTGYYPDPDPGDSWLCSGVPSKASQGGQNDYHYCDQTGKMDSLFAQGLASADAATRKKAYDAIQQYQYDNVLMVPLYARANVYGYTDRLVFPPSSAFGGWAFSISQWDIK
jgi:peptide/nickel transport system substrate-binding protein